MLDATSTYNWTDISGLNDLKQNARKDQHGALLDVARQFEAMFMKMMLKSMRDASFGDPIFDNNQSHFYRDMFDNQLALNLSKGRGMGLAEVLARQLGQQLPVKPEDAPQAGQDGQGLPANADGKTKSALPVTPVSPVPVATPAMHKPEAALSQPGLPNIAVSKAMTAKQKITAQQNIEAQQKRVEPAAVVETRAEIKTTRKLGDVDSFVRTLWPMAEKAAKELNTKPEVLLAQAALETGWGKYVSQDASSGKNSYNLFNIKAGSGWDGDFVEKQTVEFKHGKAVTEKARFRAYESYEESFRDYVKFLKGSDRYQPALAVADKPAEYITGLHKAGYATDPDYADKIIRIMDREWQTFDKIGVANAGVHSDV